MYQKKFYLFLAFAGFFLNSYSQVPPKFETRKYDQEIKSEIVLPAAAGKNVIKLFATQNRIITVTKNGVFSYQNGNWNGHPNKSNWETATIDAKGKVWLASNKIIQQGNESKIIALPEFVQKDTVLCLFWEDEKTLDVGTSGGLFTWNGSWTFQKELQGIRVNAIAEDSQKTLWVATTNGLWRRSEGKWVNLDEKIMAVGNERKYFFLETHNEGSEVIFGAPWSVGCIAQNGNHWVLSGADGLPFGPVKMIRFYKNTMWFGTDQGAIKKDSAWHYYNGRRWLPDNKVNDILPVDSLTVWIATPNGISQIKKVEMTLEQKADTFERIIDLRHNRRGLINISHLAVPGDLSASHTENEDNDGLWTSCYLAAECFRYAATKDSGAKANAVRTFEALERLETVTGIPGYPARSYAASTDVVKQSRSPHPKHWHLSPDGKWQWLDDTSSDEITGHLFALPIFYELVADNTQKERIRNLINRIVSNIVDNNFQLIDYDGKPTRWGIWNPDSLNHSPNWMYERCLNSLQILSFLKTASHLTGNPKFEKTYNLLVNKYGYAKNAFQAKVYGPYETSYSDDILNFFPYYNLIKYAGNDPNLPIYIKSLERTWNVVKPDRMPVWNVMASALLTRNCGLGTALEELKLYPLDLINWTMKNSQRWDLQHDRLVDRHGSLQATKPVPTPESGISRWNTNPKELDVGNGGKTEETGTYFLLPYWMGRYYGYFVEK